MTRVYFTASYEHADGLHTKIECKIEGGLVHVRVLEGEIASRWHPLSAVDAANVRWLLTTQVAS